MPILYSPTSTDSTLSPPLSHQLLSETDLSSSRLKFDEKRSKGKGKARAIDETVYEQDEDVEDSNSEPSQYPPLSDVNKQSKTVEETMRRWSEAERAKRAASRRISHQSSAPVTLSNLSRTGSTIIRRTSSLRSLSQPKPRKISSIHSDEIIQSGENRRYTLQSLDRLDSLEERYPIDFVDSPVEQASTEHALKLGSRFIEDLSSQVRPMGQLPQLGSVDSLPEVVIVSPTPNRPELSQLPSYASGLSSLALISCHEAMAQEKSLGGSDRMGWLEWFCFGCWGREGEDDQAGKTCPDL